MPTLFIVLALQACQPVERVRAWHAAPESAMVKGRALPRTKTALQQVYPAPSNKMELYPGERLQDFFDARHVGYAVFDGCDVIPEWSDSTTRITIDAVHSVSIGGASRVPAALRDPRGYRVMNVNKGAPRFERPP